MQLTLGSCEIVGVFGPMASGKTYLIERWLESRNRYVRFDVTGETLDNPRVEHFWQNPEGSGVQQMYDRITTKPYYFRIAFHPGKYIRHDFNLALAALWRRKEIFKDLVVDEFHEVCSVNSTPEEVETMLRYARHAHMGMIGASQRIADVSKLFTAGARQVVLFRSDDARDKDAVASRWGGECEDAYGNLRPLLFDDEKKITKQVPQCIVIRRGERPAWRIYDFQTDSYASASGQSESIGDTSHDPEAIQCEDNPSPEMQQGGSDSAVPELRSSPEEPSSS